MWERRDSSKRACHDLYRTRFVENLRRKKKASAWQADLSGEQKQPVRSSTLDLDLDLVWSGKVWLGLAGWVKKKGLVDWATERSDKPLCGCEWTKGQSRCGNTPTEPWAGPKTHLSDFILSFFLPSFLSHKAHVSRSQLTRIDRFAVCAGEARWAWWIHCHNNSTYVLRFSPQLFI